MDGLTALHHAISEGHGEAAITLLKAGAETDKKDANGIFAIDMAPDASVSNPFSFRITTYRRISLAIARLTSSRFENIFAKLQKWRV